MPRYVTSIEASEICSIMDALMRHEADTADLRAYQKAGEENVNFLKRKQLLIQLAWVREEYENLNKQWFFLPNARATRDQQLDVQLKQLVVLMREYQTALFLQNQSEVPENCNIYASTFSQLGKDRTAELWPFIERARKIKSAYITKKIDTFYKTVAAQYQLVSATELSSKPTFRQRLYQYFFPQLSSTVLDAVCETDTLRDNYKADTINKNYKESKPPELKMNFQLSFLTQIFKTWALEKDPKKILLREDALRRILQECSDYYANDTRGMDPTAVENFMKEKLQSVVDEVLASEEWSSPEEKTKLLPRFRVFKQKVGAETSEILDTELGKIKRLQAPIYDILVESMPLTPDIVAHVDELQKFKKQLKKYADPLITKTIALREERRLLLKPDEPTREAITSAAEKMALITKITPLQKFMENVLQEIESLIRALKGHTFDDESVCALRTKFNNNYQGYGSKIGYIKDCEELLTPEKLRELLPQDILDDFPADLSVIQPLFSNTLTEHLPRIIRNIEALAATHSAKSTTAILTAEFAVGTTHSAPTTRESAATPAPVPQQARGWGISASLTNGLNKFWRNGYKLISGSDSADAQNSGTRARSPSEH